MAKKRRKAEEIPATGEPTHYDIILAPDAVRDLKRLRGFERSQVRDALDHYLRDQPTRTSKARIKRLRGVRKPQYRLRVGDDIRVFYDVQESWVEILAIIPKSKAEEWLKEKGIAE